MRPGQIDPRVSVGTRFLIVGFVGALLLSVLILGMGALESSRVEQETLETADTSYSTYHLAKVGEELARLRSHLAFGLSETPEEFGQHAGRIAAIEARLGATLEVVPETLDGVALVRWIPLRVQIEELRRVYTTAASAIRTGERTRATEILRIARPMMTSVHDALDALEVAHREAVLVELRAAHRSAAAMVTLELALAGVFLTGMTAIFGAMIGMLRRQQRRVAEYTARLEAANADLDAFAGRVAHDLRNALGPIVVAPSLLREAPGDQGLVLRTADRTERASRRALAIVDALLAFARATRDAEADESVAVRACVRNVLEELAPQVAQVGATVEVDELPDLHVRCSPGLLHIVLANLCGNAVKYLEGRPERRVRIAAHADGASCRIEVEDTGPGIPAHALEKIFEPFYRVGGTAVSGTGIGLATVRRIVEARGGRVAVESDPARGGSRFFVWLPLVPRRDVGPRQEVGLDEHGAGPARA